MNQRTILRSIAKARLKALQVPHVNKSLGVLNVYGRPMWREVFDGRLAKKAVKAQMKKEVNIYGGRV